MKIKITKYIWLIVTCIGLPLILFVCSCSSEYEKREKAAKKLEEKYIEACSKGDFEKAREIVEKIVPIGEDWAQKGRKYVNDKEIYYLLAKPSRENDMRIFYLYNTFEEKELPDMKDVTMVAISMGDTPLASKLIKGGVKVNLDVVKAAVNAEDKELVRVLVTKNPSWVSDSEVREFVVENLDSQFVEELDKKVITLLNRRLNEIKKHKPNLLTQGVYNWYDDNLKSCGTGSYNASLKELYGEALNIGNKDVAIGCVNAMLPTVEVIEGDSDGRLIHGYKVDGNHKLVYHNFDDIKRLKEELGTM